MANKFIFADNASSTLGSTLTNVATTLTAAAGTGVKFPAPAAGQQFALTLTDAATQTLTEIVYVTNVTGDTMTIVRAQEGTTALAWGVGDIIQNRWTAGSASALAQQVDVQVQAGNYAVDTGTANAAVITLSVVPATQAALVGVPIRVKKIASANTTAVTLNVNGLGAQAVTLTDGTALTSGQLPSGAIFQAMWNGTTYQLQSLPGGLGGGTAGGDLTGTYPNPTINTNVVTNAKLAQMAALTLKGNASGITANAADLSIASVLALLGLVTSFANPGYVNLFGFIVQWGTTGGISQNNGSQVITLPLTFPTANLWAGVASLNNPSAGIISDFDIWPQVVTKATNSITVLQQSTPGADASKQLQINWLCLGN